MKVPKVVDGPSSMQTDAGHGQADDHEDQYRLGAMSNFVG